MSLWVNYVTHAQIRDFFLILFQSCQRKTEKFLNPWDSFRSKTIPLSCSPKKCRAFILKRKLLFWLFPTEISIGKKHFKGQLHFQRNVSYFLAFLTIKPCQCLLSQNYPICSKLNLDHDYQCSCYILKIFPAKQSKLAKL